MADTSRTSQNKTANGSVSVKSYKTGARERAKDQRRLMTQALDMLSRSGEGNPFTRLWSPQSDNDRRIATAYNNESAARYRAWQNEGHIGDQTGSLSLRSRNRARQQLRANPDLARRYNYKI